MQNNPHFSPVVEVEPKNMSDELLVFLNDTLGRYQAGAIPETDQEALHIFVARWVREVSEVHPAPHMKSFSGLSNELTCIVLSELDYLVREELKSRQAGHPTYKSDVVDFFDLNRIRNTKPDFLRGLLRRKYLHAIADGDLSGPMSSISSLFDKYRTEANP